MQGPLPVGATRTLCSSIRASRRGDVVEQISNATSLQDWGSQSQVKADTDWRVRLAVARKMARIY
jgi:hypothetical protein